MKTGRGRRAERFKVISLENFLPEEHINYFRDLRIGSKKIKNAKIKEI